MLKSKASYVKILDHAADEMSEPEDVDRSKVDIQMVNVRFASLISTIQTANITAMIQYLAALN